MSSEVRHEARGRREGAIGLGLASLFLLLGLPWILVAHIDRMGFGHVLYATITALGLWAGFAGLRRGGRANRIGAGLALAFFLAVAALTVLRASASLAP